MDVKLEKKMLQVFILVTMVINCFALCPLECNCWTDKQNKVNVECTNQGLKYVPQHIPPTSEYLNLSHNSLMVLRNGSFHDLRSLKVLDLAFNELKSLQLDCFDGLNSLKVLIMIHNKLLLTDGTYLPGVFRPLKGLTYINIMGNSPSMFPNSNYPDEAMTDLVNLKTLKIDGISLGKFGYGFRNLNALEELVLSGETGYCDLIQISNSTFMNLFGLSLKRLSLRECAIYRLYPTTFDGFTSLKVLDISENHHLGVTGIKNISYSLPNTNISVLKMNRINVHGDPVVIERDTIQEFNKTNITYLSLNGNKMYAMSKDSVSYLPMSLEYLSLRNNKIIRVEFLRDLVRLKNLKILDGSYQSHFTSIHLSKNHKYETENKSDEKQALTFIFPRKGKKDDPLQLPPNLQVIIANNLKLRYEVPSVSFAPNKVSYIDSSSNGLLAWTGAWTGLHQLTFLNLSNNELFRLDPESFRDMKSLKTLFLQGNKLGQTIMLDKQSITFANQHELETLDLSDNKIYDIPRYLFSGLRKLKVLRLSGNFLTSIGFKLLFNYHLQVLDLSNNLLSDIDMETQNVLDSIAIKHNLSFDLSDNRLHCKCEQVQFMEWLKRTSVNFINYETYNCIFTNGSKLNLITSLDRIIDELHVRCISGTIILICVLGFFGLSFILALPIILYYKRHRLMYLYHVGRRNYNPLTADNTDRSQDSVDAFISYADNSSALVRRFAEYVERARQPPEENLHLFIPDRNMIAGQNERASTVSAISASSCVIVFLTKVYFHRSEKKVFEFNCAITEGIRKKHQNIKVVFVEELDARNVDKELLMFCRGNENHCYVNWMSEMELFRSLESDIQTYKTLMKRAR